MSAASKTVLTPTSVEDLPDDVEVLKAMLWQVMLSNDELAQQVAFLKRNLWGKKSEKLLSKDQLALFEAAKERLPDEPDDEAGAEHEAPSTAANEQSTPPRLPKDKAKTRRGGKRGKKRGRFLGGTVPKDTPVHPTHIGLDGATCPECGDPLRVLGHDVRDRVEFRPGHFFIDRTVVDTGICLEHPKQSLHTPEGPDFIVPGGVLGNELLCKVVVDKFADHLPLKRQSKRFARKGVHLPSCTLSRNAVAFAALAKPIVDAMRDELLTSPWLQGDATGLPIIIGNLGQTHPGQLWVYSNGESAVFQVSLTKHGDFPKTFLDGFEGIWLADGASNYNAVAAMPGVERAGCWSHARRYVFDARNDHIAAYEGLQLIRDLFMGERAAVTLSPEQRRQHRLEHAKPLLERIRIWVDQHRRCDHVVRRPKSAFAKAIGYLHRQWAALTLFVDRPEIAVHNNRSELLLRTPVIGRKNWLFAGSPAGADASARLFSLTTSCMLQGVDPMVYLLDVMPSLGRKTTSEVPELTPARWAARRREAKAAATAA